jgi:hypothetical protein
VDLFPSGRAASAALGPGPGLRQPSPGRIEGAAVSATPSTLSIATDHSKRGRRVALCCPPDEHGNCRFPQCGKYDESHQLVPHERKEVGKAPIGRLFPKGINGATTNTASLDRMLREIPDANISVDLASTGWFVVDTDSDETEAAELANGLDGAVVRESRHRAYVFTRPADCPTINLIKAEGDALDILTVGNFLVHGTHQSGVPIRLDPNAKPGPAPARYVEILKQKAASDAASAAAAAARREERAKQYGGGPEPPVRLHQRGQRRWLGELVEMKNGKVDRDLSLWFIALDLAECGASESAIVAALEERDVSLGWEKFTHRKDDREYVKIAEKVVASTIEKERAPRIQFTAATAVPDDIAALRAAIEERDAEIVRLQRRALDQDDRLEILEDIVHSIDDVLNRPNEEMSASEKVVLIGTARWLPFYRSKKEANGQPKTIALGYVAKVVGMSKSTVSSTFKRFSSKDEEDGAPFRKNVTRKKKFDDDGQPVIDPRTGQQAIESELELIPWKDRPSETLRAAVSYAKVQTKPKHGGSQEAADARWGRCGNHDNREVRVRGYCPDCGKVVGERVMTVEEFDVLNEQVAHSEGDQTTVSSSNPIDEQVAHSEQPTSLLDYAAARSEEQPAKPKPWRCAELVKGQPCGSLEGHSVLNGHRWRCDGCGDITLPPKLPAVMGAEE